MKEREHKIKKYVQINVYSGTWADSVVFGKHYELQDQGVESYVFWARGNHEQNEYMMKIASYPESCVDALQTRLSFKAHNEALASKTRGDRSGCRTLACAAWLLYQYRIII